MRELTITEMGVVSGAKPKFLNFVGGALIGAITGFFVGGPPGAIAGAYTGAAGVTIKEGAFALTELLHPELSQ